MIQSITSQGLVLYNRNFREDDKLVKIFTEQAGKRMFFVKHAGQSKLAPVIQPLVLARFLLRINDDGLSYIEDYHEVMTFPKINSDLFVMAYATYVAALADASLQDNQQDAPLFAFLQKTLELMEEGLDYQVLTNIFEIQILTRFGISLNFNECVFCHRIGQAFDFSFKYGACLCPDHYHEDERRCHLNPNIPYLLNQFQAIDFETLETISLKLEIKQELRQFMDQLYEEYVGIHLKSKKFIDSLADWGDIEVQLYGDEAKIKQYLTATERVSIIHTDEKIDSDDEPTRAIRKKKNASMVLAAKAVKEGEADAVLSAGNTGALLAAGFFIVGRIKNIDRPGLMSTLPTVDGKGFDMLDLGANAENTAQHLHQYAVLGSFYAKNVRGIAQPRVGLLNNGTESSKGDPLRKETYELLAADESLNFIGNVEARDLMNGVADVVVADGFTGNAVLKSIEGTAMGIMGLLKTAITDGGLRAKLGALLLKDSLRGLKKQLNYSDVGGAVLFGVKAPVVKTHGSSDAKAVYSTIRQIRTMLETDVVAQTAREFSGE